MEARTRTTGQPAGSARLAIAAALRLGPLVLLVALVSGACTSSDSTPPPATPSVAAGVLDDTFGGDFNPADGTPDGFVVHDGAAGGVGRDQGEAVALDSAGNILVAGLSTNAAGDYDLALWRFTPAGVLDATFGGDVNPADGTPDGFVLHHGAAGGNGFERGSGIAIDGSGNILVTGYSDNGAGDGAMVVWRFTPAGILDLTFGGDVNPADGTPDGFVVQDDPAGVGYDSGYAIGVDAAGKIVVAGYSTSVGGLEDLVLWRLTSAGVLDSTFGGDVNPADGTPDGFVIHNNAAGGGGTDIGTALAFDGAGNILVAGYSSDGSHDMVLWRFTPAGALDTTFGGDFNPADSIPDGFVVHGDAAGGTGFTDGAYGVRVDAEGRIVVAGYSYAASNDGDLVVWRFLPDGTPDDTFGGDFNPADGTPDGFVVHNEAAGGGTANLLDLGQGVTLDAVGNIVVVGDSINPANTDDMALWRFTSGGVLDAAFGGDVNPADGTPDGFVTHDGAAGGTGNERGLDLVIDDAGRIVVVGYSDNASGDRELAVWRYR